MKSKLILTCILYILLFTGQLFAHPHIAIDTHPVFVFDAGIFKGVRVTWVWDEMFSDQIMIDYDKNENDKFEPEELKGVEQLMHNTKDYNYFSKIVINGNEINDIKIEYFKAFIDADAYVIKYSFFIPVNQPIGSGDMSISYVNNDPTIYISFSTSSTPESLDEETKNVNVFDSSVKGYSYYGYEFSVKVHAQSIESKVE